MANTTNLPAVGALAQGSAAARAAGAAVQALARAARSFVLYDPQNAVVRQLLEAWREKSRAALDAHGPLPLEVRPFDLSLHGEVIYEDQDREKSMAFKLYRDGIRRLTLLPQATWAELLELLQIVALRYTAIRQQEEDAVTLLRAAELQGVQMVAVEGLAPDEERPEDDGGVRERALGVQVPVGWDTPLPRLPAPAVLAWRPVAPQDLAALRAEEGGEGLAGSALALARDLLAEAVRGQWPQPHQDLIQFFAELRDALLADGQLQALRQLVDLIGEVGAGQVREQLLGSLGDARTLDLILDGLGQEAVDLPAGLMALVPLLGLEATLDRMVAEPGERRRALLVKLVLARLPRGAELLLQRLPQLPADLARGLVRGLVARVPERALEAARLLLHQPDDGLRAEGLEALARAPGQLHVAPVAALLDDASPAIRLKAAEVLGQRGDETAVEALLASLEAKERTLRDAEALGRALAEVAPIPASRHFASWLRPKGRFLMGVSARDRRLQWAAVAGTAALPGAEAEKQLQALAQEADEELRRHCLAALARRRKGAGHA